MYVFLVEGRAMDVGCCSQPSAGLWLAAGSDVTGTQTSNILIQHCCIHHSLCTLVSAQSSECINLICYYTLKILMGNL